MNCKKIITVLGGLCILVCLASCSKSDNRAEPDNNKDNVRPITSSSSPYVDSVFSYTPAPSQFINTDLANITTVHKIIENKMISLGAWGGQIVLGFDHTVLNKQGNDLKITGNAGAQMAEPGIVWVMNDANGNGKPDDTWYELKGSASDEVGYKRKYSVTYFKPSKLGQDIAWEDNNGQSGVINTNTFYTQSYYPEWIDADSYTLEGSLLPTSGIDNSNPGLVTSAPFDFGYADNRTIAEGGDVLDISQAIDDNGLSIDLYGIDFIRIQTGIMMNFGRIGECSTELSSVGDLHML